MSQPLPSSTANQSESKPPLWQVVREVDSGEAGCARAQELLTEYNRLAGAAVSLLTEYKHVYINPPRDPRDMAAKCT
jgi:hypothetical protein